MQLQLLLDEIAHLLEQVGSPLLQRLAHPFPAAALAAATARYTAERRDLAVKLLQPHLVHDALHIEAALGEKADVLHADGRGCLLHAERQAGLIVLQQHFGQRAVGIVTAEARVVALWLVILLVILAVAEAVGAEEVVEGVGECVLLLLRLRQGEGKRGLETFPVLPPYQLRHFQCIQRICDRHRHIGAAQGFQEIGERAFHWSIPVGRVLGARLA